MDDHEPDKDYEKPKVKLISAQFVNETALLLNFDMKFDDNSNLPIVDVSDDKSSWKSYQMLPNGYLLVQKPAKYVKLENSNDIITITEQDREKVSVNNTTQSSCMYKEKTFEENEEYNDNCESLCVCKNGKMKCLKLECPTYFGVELLDPNCIEWETVPANFKPDPPRCCPEKIRCKNNGSCLYQGQTYNNWDQLPENVTGCEKRCTCEMGKVECQNICPPVTAVPPPDLHCPPHQANIGHIPEDNCCMYWTCNQPGMF